MAGKKKKIDQFEEVPDVEYKDGEVIFNVESNLGNGDWLRTLRLMKAGKEEEVRQRFATRAYRRKK